MIVFKLPEQIPSLSVEKGDLLNGALMLKRRKESYASSISISQNVSNKALSWTV